MFYRIVLLLPLLILPLTGCGQKGPLYLPAKAPPAPQAAVQPPAPVAADLPQSEPAPSGRSATVPSSDQR